MQDFFAKRQSTGRILRRSILTSLLLSLLVVLLSFSQAQAGGLTPSSADAEPQAPDPADGYQIFLPTLQHPGFFLSNRIGYNLTVPPLDRYPEAGSLKAGWYLDWTVRVHPERPNGIEYAQVVRLHQKLACPLSAPNAWDRDACPYVEGEYILRTPQSRIEAAAQANPGSLWLIGNEMDRRDWKVCDDYPTCDEMHTFGQDETLPETYAKAYHDIYQIIKDADPTARVAIGGVIQATPLRLEYLTRIWDSYKERYGTEMPVDVWNVHNFILREQADVYGAEIPPGSSETIGAYVQESDWLHIDRTTFDQQIRDFRQWMKDRGQQQKPLIVSEYGVLYSHCAGWDWVDNVYTCVQDFMDETVIHDFMVWTWDYFLTEKDCSLGYEKDDCRLVQRWNWFSADHVGSDGNGNLSYGHNPFTSLFDSTTRQPRKAGELFRQFSLDRYEELHNYSPQE